MKLEKWEKNIRGKVFVNPTLDGMTIVLYIVHHAATELHSPV